MPLSDAQAFTAYYLPTGHPKKMLCPDTFNLSTAPIFQEAFGEGAEVRLACIPEVAVKVIYPMPLSEDPGDCIRALVNVFKLEEDFEQDNKRWKRAFPEKEY